MNKTNDEECGIYYIHLYTSRWKCLINILISEYILISVT